MVAPSQMFIGDLGYSQRLAGDTMVGEIAVTDHLRVPGTQLVRSSVLATLADVVTGVLATKLTLPRFALTLDLTVIGLSATHGERLMMSGRILKAGSTVIATEARFTEPAGERPVAYSYVTFMRAPKAEDVMEAVADARPFGPTNMDAPFAEQLGARVLRPGVVELERRPYVMQPTGTIQGGAVALLGELAAESLLGAPVVDLDVRYLSTVRVGPAITSATQLDRTTARVEVRDTGNGDRLTTLMICRTTAGHDAAAP
jgi:acyl-coenzyme A thioesterase PaaI-like protein